MIEPRVKDGMPCPVCKVDLMMTDRQGIEIDYCPKCRGVWLDRGELDKIVARSADEAPAMQAAEPAGRYRDERYRRDDDDDRRRYDERHRDDRYHHRKRRGSWLGDMFDLD